MDPPPSASGNSRNLPAALIMYVHVGAAADADSTSGVALEAIAWLRPAHDAGDLPAALIIEIHVSAPLYHTGNDHGFEPPFRLDQRANDHQRRQ